MVQNLTDNRYDCCDVDFCQKCEILIPEDSGYFIDRQDIGKDADGGTADVFRADINHCGNVFTGFKEEDLGAWCDNCSWYLQEKRSKSTV